MLGKSIFDLIYGLVASNFLWLALAGIFVGIVFIGVGAVKAEAGKKGVGMIQKLGIALILIVLFPSLVVFGISMLGSLSHNVSNLNTTNINQPVPVQITPIDFGGGSGGSGVTIGPVSTPTH